MKKAFLLLASVAMLTACSITRKSSTVAPLTPRVVATYMTADLEVDEYYVTADTEGMNHGRRLKGLKSECESYAVAKALEKSGADVLVDPKFTYTYRKMRLVKVSVTGYPARYRNFHKATPEEVDPLFNQFAIPVSNTSAVVVVPAKTNR